MDISDWRDKIDDADRRILEMLNERARYVLALVRLKKSAGIPIYEPRREEAVFENIRAHNGGPLPSDAVQRIFERIIDEMRAIQRAPLEDPPEGEEE